MDRWGAAESPSTGTGRSRGGPHRTDAPSTAPARTSLLGRAARPLRIALATAAALVLAVTGTAWGLYRDLTAGITTTDVITAGGDGGAQNILLVGVDSRTDAQGNPLPPEVLRGLNSGADTGVLNADTIMLLHVPDGGGAAVAFSVPRDSYVDIPGYRTDKINAAYPATKAITADQLVADGVRDRARIETESAQAGRSALIRTVESLTGVTVDHYAEINLLGFYNLTNAIGGVDVCLTAPVDDDLSGARFPAGPQTISGGAALAFVRQRYGLPGGDLSRIRRQQAFLAAVADKVLSTGTLTDPSRLAGLIDVAQRSLVIDSGWDVLAFAQQASDIAAGDLAFVTIPTLGTETNVRGDVVRVDRAGVQDFVTRRIAEQEVAAEADERADVEADVVPPPPTPGPVEVIASRYVLDVRNGSTTPRIAATVAEHLSGVGFVRGTVDNTGATPRSVVRYTDPDSDAAGEVADQLGDLATERSDDVPRGHLLVVIGDDFDPAVVPEPADPPPADAAPVPCID